jgi:hypothetical protein
MRFRISSVHTVRIIMILDGQTNLLAVAGIIPTGTH